MAKSLNEHGFTQFFREFYLFPMASAIWSCAQNAVKEFPAAMLTRFFHNHGMLTLSGHPRWKTIPGGCSRYIGPITEPYRKRVFSGIAIRKVVRKEEGVTLTFGDSRPDMSFEEVVFAVNCDRVLPLLDEPTEQEREVLGHFSTSRNHVVLHCDDRLLPRAPEARASWNYLLHLDSRNGNGPVTMTYHMNRLQSLPGKENYCVTLNPNGAIRPEKILRKFVYHHPIFTLEAMQAQEKWNRISGANRTHFCGAYWSYGFHEDGVKSALRVAESLGVRL